MQFLSITKAAQLLGVHEQTLRNWDRRGILVPMRLPSGQRRYRSQDLEALLGTGRGGERRCCSVYARVSTKKQEDMGNLERQKERLLAKSALAGYHVVSVESDVASGLNTKRRGLASLIRTAKEGKIDTVLIEHRGRLAGFGYEYLQQLFDVLGVAVVVTVEEEDAGKGTAIHAELVEDLVSIVSSCGARLYGSRGGRRVKGGVLKAVALEEEAIEAA